MREKHADILSFDLEKAFDRVPSVSITNQLMEWGAGHMVVRYVEVFLKQRKFSVNINGFQSSSKELKIGVPQGSPLSPQLFNIYIASLSGKLKENRIKHWIYGDNILVLCSGNKNSRERKAGGAILVLNNWSGNNNGKIAGDKVDALHVCRKRLCVPAEINFGDNILQFKENIKILGVTFNGKLSFNNHVESMLTKMKRTNNLLRFICRRKFCPPVDVAINIARALQIGRFDHAIQIYDFTSEKNLGKIQVVINQAARFAVGALRCSKIEALLAETGFPLVEERRDELAIRSVFKAIYNINNPLHKTCRNMLENLEGVAHISSLYQSICRVKQIDLDIAVPQRQFVPAPRWGNWQKFIDLSLSAHKKSETSPEEYRMRFKETVDRYANYTHLYTDASKTLDTTGIAVTDRYNTIASYILP